MLIALKNFFSRFLPAPARAFHDKIGAVLERIDALAEKQEEHGQALGEIKSALEELGGAVAAASKTAAETACAVGAVEISAGKIQADAVEIKTEIQRASVGIREISAGVKAAAAGIQKAREGIVEGFEKAGSDIAGGMSGIEGEIEASSDMLQTLQKDIGELKNIGKLDELDERLRKFGADSKDNFKGVFTDLYDIKNKVPSRIWYTHRLERNALVNTGFYDAIESGGFEEIYLNLISGLDPLSTETVNDIISKIVKIKGTSGKVDIYTNDQKEYIRSLESSYYSKIFKISGSLYSYKHYMLPVNNFEMPVFFDRHGLGKVSAASLNLISGRDIIDAGAFAGDSAIVLSEYTSKKVHSFEAASENYGLMLETIKLNHKSNIIPVNLALGSANKFQEINFADTGSTFGYQIKESQYTETVRVITLDSYAAQNGLDVGLIKADIEGSEMELLEGARETIKRCLPVLIISIYHSAHDFFNIKSLLESWDLNYTFQIHKPCDGQVYFETVLIAESNAEAEKESESKKQEEKYDKSN